MDLQLGDIQETAQQPDRGAPVVARGRTAVDVEKKVRGFWNRMAPLYDLAMGGDAGLREAIAYVTSFVGPRDVALGFADGSFDVSVAGNVLHLLPDPESAVSELRRVMRAGGTIVVPNYMNQEDTDRRFLRLASAVGFAAKQPLCVAVCRA